MQGYYFHHQYDQLPYDKRYLQQDYQNYERIDQYLYKEQSERLMNQENTIKGINYFTFVVKEQILFLRQLKRMAEELKKLEINVLSVFQLFSGDKLNQILIDKYDFRDMMQSHITGGDPIRLCDVELLFSSLNDFSQNNTIGYFQFHKLFTFYGKCVSHTEQINLDQLKEKIQPVQQIVIDSVVRYVQMVLNMEINLENMRQKIDNQMINFVMVFQILDTDMNGFVKSQEIFEFLIKQNILTSIEEAGSYIAMLDRTKRGQIQLQQFLQYIKPKSLAVYD